jgi:hypothetical protein
MKARAEKEERGKNELSKNLTMIQQNNGSNLKPRQPQAKPKKKINRQARIDKKIKTKQRFVRTNDAGFFCKSVTHSLTTNKGIIEFHTEIKRARSCTGFFFV